MARAYPSYICMKQMLVQPHSGMSPVPVYTPGWRKSSLSKETTRQERLEPRTSRTGAQGVINHSAHTPPHGRKHLISKKLSSFNNEQILYQSNFQGKTESNSNLIPIKRRFAIRSVGKPIYHTHLATHRLINLGIVRESSFNMTRGGDEDMETRSLKF